MPSRSSRYYDNDVSEKPLKMTRMGRNKHLYDEINNKIGYEDISSLDTQTRIDLSALTGINKASREEYQKIKEYKEFIPQEEKVIKPKEKVIKEPKSFDINSILEEARKNRVEVDELESKRKPKEDDLSSIERIKDQDVNYKNDFDEEELKDLINTITSHELKDDIESANEKGLLDDLIATNVDLRVTEGIAEESITESNKLKLENTYNEEEPLKIDNSFYTKSMDLSEQDFDFSDEIEQENQKTRKKLLVIVIIILIIGLAVGGYFTLKKMGII